MTSPRRRRPELPGFEHLRHCNAGSSDPTFTNRSGLVEEKPVVNRPSFRVVLAALSMVVVACGSAQDGDAPAAGEPAAESASSSPRQT